MVFDTVCTFEVVKQNVLLNFSVICTVTIIIVNYIDEIGKRTISYLVQIR